MPFQNILRRLKRETSSGNYLPEVDGLRFLAIAMVLFFHMYWYFVVRHVGTYADALSDYPWLSRVMVNGRQGVELFFVISGFILALPFAGHYLKQKRNVALKQYFLRRVTRLEPPYLLALVILFLASIAVGKYTFAELFPSLLASVVYLHNIIFQQYPLVTVIAWSLEVEVQFYILAPLLATVFALPPWGRRLALLTGILGMPLLQAAVSLPFVSLYNFLQFFLTGFLLADVYLTERVQLPNRGWSIVGGSLLLFSILWLDMHASLWQKSVYPLAIGSFFFLVFAVPFWRKLFSRQVLAVIGGMCYSIYLWHYALISLFGPLLLKKQITAYFLTDFFLYTLLQLIPILVFSSLYFYLIEKPCMRRDWYKHLWFWKSQAYPVNK
ncbi:acyltransferase family protein [Catalinimonas alkaloidigena]|uniref:acyltransferase family protein n=1 Tax=Catalinimonas alkaloidigena TaxID=1075417 RepID=UPI00115FBF01|nr:acyltransferase [Catalinimonas alkaloidigena]